MTFLSCFSGIGGLDLGLEWAGWRCVGQIEQNPYCRGVLRRHWPNVWQWGDIRLLDDIPAELGPIAAVVGGVPCQPASVAGRRRSSADPRWLWPDFLRVVQLVRPVWVLAENVPGLASLKPHGLDWIIGELAAAGYTVTTVVVGARHVGAPHRRDRLWIVGNAGGGRLEGRGLRCPPRAALPVGGGASATGMADANGAGESNKDEHQSRAGGSKADVGWGGDWELAYPNEFPGQRPAGVLHGIGATHRHNPDGRHRWPARWGEPQHSWEAPRAVKPRMGRFADGAARRLALTALGNAVVPQCAEVIARAINAVEAA